MPEQLDLLTPDTPQGPPRVAPRPPLPPSVAFPSSDPAPQAALDGATIVPDWDASRLNRQQRLVWDVMRDERWYTLHLVQTLIDHQTGEYCSEAAISARIRDFRKPEGGRHAVERRRVGDPRRGHFEYRLVLHPYEREGAA